MILRSLTKHVKDQNWFAVGLDFSIVVDGVFRGIQPGNWNEKMNNAFKKRAGMKPNMMYGLLTAVTLTACQSGSTALTDEHRAAIQVSSKTWVETYNRNDWEGLADLFTPDAIMMPPNAPAVRGRTAIAEWEQVNETGFRIAFDLETIEGNADTAYVSGRSCVFIPNGAGGYGIDAGKFLEVREKQTDGTWLIKTDIFNSDLSVGVDLIDACPFDVSQTTTPPDHGDQSGADGAARSLHGTL